MIENPGIGNLRNLLTSVKTTGEALTLKAGSIVKARVVDVNDKGDALLRLLTESGGPGNRQGTIVKAYSEVPLTKGQNLYLEILGGKNNVTMRFVGNVKTQAGTLEQNIPVKFLDMLTRLSGSRLGNTEIHELLHMLRSLPRNIRAALPGLQNLENLLLDIKQLDGKLLKAFVENSGVAFETRLKIALMSDPGSVLQNLLALQAEGDLKAMLLRLKKLLSDSSVIPGLKASGFKIQEMSGMVERFLNNIEFFQLSSKINDMFCTFMPVLWDDLQNGEFLFKKGSKRGKPSYTCDINLDLKSMGRLSVSVTVMDKSFYVTFLTEKREIGDLISSQKHLLETRFASQGLNLKAINFNYKKNIIFGKAQQQDISVKI